MSGPKENHFFFLKKKKRRKRKRKSIIPLERKKGQARGKRKAQPNLLLYIFSGYGGGLS
jgi:hypothetical protein